MKHLVYVMAALMALCSATGCGKKQSENSVKAQVQAVDAVKRIAAIDSTDTMALQSELLKAEALRSQYVVDGDSIAAADFDDTFRETLIQKAPKLAKLLYTTSTEN